MANWPTEPQWTELAALNGGKEFSAGDGLIAYDINAIIKDLLYIKKYGGGSGSSDGSTTIISNRNTITVIKAVVRLAEANTIILGE